MGGVSLLPELDRARAGGAEGQVMARSDIIQDGPASGDIILPPVRRRVFY